MNPLVKGALIAATIILAAEVGKLELQWAEAEAQYSAEQRERAAEAAGQAVAGWHKSQGSQ